MSQIKINSKNIIIVEWNDESSIIKNNHTYIKSMGFVPFYKNTNGA